MEEVVSQTGDERRERDQRHRPSAAEVGPHHDLLAIDSIRDHSGRRCKQNGRHRVGQDHDRHRRAAAGDLEGEHDQREQKELVRQLRRELRKPDVPEGGEAEDGPKAARRFDRKPDWRLHRGQSLATRFGVERPVKGLPFAEVERLGPSLRFDTSLA